MLLSLMRLAATVPTITPTAIGARRADWLGSGRRHRLLPGSPVRARLAVRAFRCCGILARVRCRWRPHPSRRAQLPPSMPQWRRPANIPFSHEACPAPSGGWSGQPLVGSCLTPFRACLPYPPGGGTRLGEERHFASDLSGREERLRRSQI